jgi:tRNA 2-thiouridine synthesizing protein E
MLDASIFDKEGFLNEPEIWTREIAVEIAAKHGLTELTPEHWKVIEFVHHHFERTQAPPLGHKITEKTGISRQQLANLFPNFGVILIVSGAGNPKPRVVCGETGIAE